MTTLANDDLTRIAFAVHENPGIFALLLGSGVSRAAEIPTGWEITKDLIRRVSIANGEKEQTDWVDWYRNNFGKNPDYSELVGDLGMSPEERRSILHSYIEPTLDDRQENRKIPTSAHYAIADLVRNGSIRVIVTTNFDRLIENALREKGIEPTVITSVDALKGAEPITHSKCYLLKLHGDYMDVRIRNTDSELSKYPPEYNALLDRIFDEFGLIVSGWSGEWDHALRDAILRCPARRYSMFWVARRDPNDVARRLIDHRAGRLITMPDSESFFQSLLDRVETLNQTRRQRTEAVELIVNSAKKYIANPDYQIQFHDLMASQTKISFEKINGASLQVSDHISKEEIRRHIGVYESSFEALSRTFGVLGRWGKDSEFGEVISIIDSTLNNADRQRAGIVNLLLLRAYPSVLLVTAYSIGLVRSRRWKVLYKFYFEQIERRGENESSCVLEDVFHLCWKGLRSEIWTNLEGLENSDRALSEHLYQLFRKWSGSFSGDSQDFEELFQLWEIIGSLAYSELLSFEEKSAALSPDHPGAVKRLPFGRSVFDRESRDRTIRRIQNSEIKNDLLEAGFFGGSPAQLDLAVDILNRTAGWLNWR